MLPPPMMQAFSPIHTQLSHANRNIPFSGVVGGCLSARAGLLVTVLRECHVSFIMCASSQNVSSMRATDLST